MTRNPTDNIFSELKQGMSLAKCRKCGCMKEALENLSDSFPSTKTKEPSDLLAGLKKWAGEMEPIKYACLGCEHCYAAEAMNTFSDAFPEAEPISLSCAFEAREGVWPPVPGEYSAFCEGESCPVAVSTLASNELSERLAGKRPKELCIVGKTETENIGIDKVIKNTITNPTIRYLLLVGKDPEGHNSGRTLLSLSENGVDENMKVINSPGRRPILKNVSKEEVDIFRKQIKLVDMIGCVNEDAIVEKIEELSKEAITSCGCGECREDIKPAQVVTAPVIKAQSPGQVVMDENGYFVIIPQPEKKIVTVEHYSYDNKLQRIIEGEEAKSIYFTIIKNGWVSQLAHAAYLGRELTKAELSIKLGFKYVQDGA